MTKQVLIQAKPARRRSFTKLIALIIVFWLTPSCVAPTPESGGPAVSQLGVVSSVDLQWGLPATVDRIIDGDTIIVTIDDRVETVRLLGIDTPEKVGGPRPAECFGSDASAYLADLLPPSTSVLLSRDQETRDQYGRLLAFVHRAGDGLFVNLVMLEGGFATPLFFAPNLSLEAPFVTAANSARRNWVGFWPACGAADLALANPDGSG